MSGQTILHAMLIIQRASFPELLTMLLEESGGTRAQLYDYLLEQNYCMDKTSMYRYFNTKKGVTRTPDEEFLAHFATYTGINDEQQQALHALWRLKRKRSLRRTAQRIA